MKLQEIEEAFSNFKICPKCNSGEGFWLGIKSDHAYVQCKSCGGNFELSEVFAFNKKRELPKRLKFFRK